MSVSPQYSILFRISDFSEKFPLCSFGKCQEMPKVISGHLLAWLAGGGRGFNSEKCPINDWMPFVLGIFLPISM